MSLAQEMNEYPYNPKQDDKMIMQQKYEIDIEDYIGRTVTVSVFNLTAQLCLK